MARTETIQARIDPEIKSKAQRILNTLNISMSEVTLHNETPFDVRIPNELTAATLRKSDEGKKLHEVGSVDELFQEL